RARHGTAAECGTAADARSAPGSSRNARGLGHDSRPVGELYTVGLGHEVLRPHDPLALSTGGRRLTVPWPHHGWDRGWRVSSLTVRAGWLAWHYGWQSLCWKRSLGRRILLRARS